MSHPRSERSLGAPYLAAVHDHVTQIDAGRSLFLGPSHRVGRRGYLPRPRP